MIKDDFQGTGNIVIFNSEDGNVKVDVIFDDETVWLTQGQMSQLFQKSTSTINEHIKNIFDEQELVPEACTHKFGNSEFMKKAPLYYNLDVIISVGYRVKSKVGTQFRRWATKRMLAGTGSVSHKQAEDKAVAEYRKYQARTLSEVETAFLDSIETLTKIEEHTEADKR